MRFAIRERGVRATGVQPEFTTVGENVVIGSTQWVGAEGERRQLFQVLTLRDGKIVDMQDCATRRQAERFALSRAR